MIKKWFLEKNFSSNERIVIETAIMSGELETLKETEKAIQFKADSDFGTFIFWCPKSCLETAEDIQKRAEQINKGLSYNETLLKIAKENGLGVRKGMKTITLRQKLSAAGIEIPER